MQLQMKYIEYQEFSPPSNLEPVMVSLYEAVNRGLNIKQVFNRRKNKDPKMGII